jgi:type II secretory pathway predicted ATPase ExeA
MNDKELLALYGLKYNPFLPAIPQEAMWAHPQSESFFARVESLMSLGGFAMLSGEVGLGKSKILHMLAERLAQHDELIVGVMERPQSKLGDFYREMGELFGVPLSPANRYGGFKALRARWRSHFKSSLLRPVLLVDEAQEIKTDCLCELRLLGSAHFDSECLLTTVLCGDTRLGDRFRSKELLPVGSRIRSRLLLEPLTREDLLDFTCFVLDQAGAPHLMNDQLKHVLCEHSAGNLRVLCNMGADLLAAGAQRQLDTLDEDLYFDVYVQSTKPRRRKSVARRANK